MNHSCSDVHQNVGPTCGPMAPLYMNIFLKRTGPKKEGLKNNSVFTLPHAPRGHIHQPLRSGSSSPGASIRSAEGPSLLSLLFVSSSRSLFLCCSPWLPAPADIHPPTFSQGPPLLADFSSPPPSSPLLIPPLLPLITNAPVTTHIFRSIFWVPLALGSSPGVKNLLRSLTALPSTGCRLQFLATLCLSLFSHQEASQVAKLISEHRTLCFRSNTETVWPRTMSFPQD